LPWNFDSDDHASRGAGHQFKFLVSAVERVEALAQIAQPDSGSGLRQGQASRGLGRPKCIARQADAIIFHRQKEFAVLAACAYSHHSRLFARLNSVPDGILNQRLQHECGHHAIQRPRLDFLFDTQFVAESGLLNLDVALDEIQFLAEGEFLPVRLAESKAQQLA
jgi:hypothetical protein